MQAPSLGASDPADEQQVSPRRLRFVGDDSVIGVLRAQQAVFAAIALGEPLQSALAALVQQLQSELASGAIASILLTDQARRHLYDGAAPDLPEEFRRAIDGIEIGPRVGSCGTAAYRGETVIVSDIALDPLWEDFRDLALSSGLRACWSVPIPSVDGEVLGTFAVYHRKPRTPEPEELEMLRGFVQAAAIGIEHSHSLVGLVQQRRRAEALEGIGRAMAAHLDLDELVQVATDAATELTQASFGAFFYKVANDSEDAFHLYTLSGAPRAAFEHFPLPRGTAIFGPTYRGEPPVRIDDVTVDPRFGHNPPYNGLPAGHLPVRSYLGVPVITAAGAVVGGMFFAHPEPGVFDAEAERLAVAIAAHAAICVENAQLYAGAQRDAEVRRLAFEERDRVARLLERSLRPADLPRIPKVRTAAYYKPLAGRIGGDFYDAFALGDGRWALVIGDVSGKGVEAAALTGLARHTVRVAAQVDSNPETVLSLLNAAVFSQQQDDRYVTAIFAVIEPGPSSTALTIACGGHQPAIVVRSSGAAELSAKGILLGLLPDIEVQSQTVQLDPGDILVLYTDGLTDVTLDGRSPQDGWLIDLLGDVHGASAATVVDLIIGSAAQHEREGIGRDDIAVLALSVEPRC